MVIPRWIVFVCCFISAFGIFVGCSLYISPGTFVKDVDFSSSGVAYLAHMFAARQISIASVIGFSALKKSKQMLAISLAAYVVMNIQDALIGASRGDSGLLIGATVFGGFAAFMCFKLIRPN